MTREFAPAPRIEVIVVRDPDGPTNTQVFVDGVPAAATQFHIDAGRGWTWGDWVETRDCDLAVISSGARGALEDAYDDPPGGDAVRGRIGDWLDGAERSESEVAE